jgi:hypothetical protein
MGILHLLQIFSSAIGFSFEHSLHRASFGFDDDGLVVVLVAVVFGFKFE